MRTGSHPTEPIERVGEIGEHRREGEKLQNNIDPFSSPFALAYRSSAVNTMVSGSCGHDDTGNQIEQSHESAVHHFLQAASKGSVQFDKRAYDERPSFRNAHRLQIDQGYTQKDERTDD